MSSIERQIGKGIIFQFFSFGIAGLVQILFIPFTVAKLGKAQYGIYEIAFSLTLLNALLEVGVGSTITNYIKEHFDTDFEEFRSFFWSFFWFKFFISLIIFIVCMLIAHNVPQVYKKVPVEDYPVLKLSIIWFAFGAILANLVSFFDNVQNGLVRYDLSSITNISSKVFFIIVFFIWFFFWENLNIAHFCLITFVLVPLFRLIHQAIQIHKIQPEILTKPTHFRFSHIQSKFHFLGGLSLITFLAQFYRYGITVLLSLIAVPSLVGEFGIIKRIIDLIAGISDMLVRPIMPAAKDLLKKYKPENLIYKVTHVHAIVVVGLTTALIINASAISKLYLNNEYPKFDLHLAIMTLPRLLPSTIVMLMLYYAEGKTKINIVNQSLKVMLAISFAFIGHQLYGFIGLLIGLSTGTIIAALFNIRQFVSYYPKVKMPIFLKIYMFVFIATACCIATQFIIQKYLGVNIASVLLWNLLALLYFWVFSKKDILLLIESYKGNK